MNKNGWRQLLEAGIALVNSVSGTGDVYRAPERLAFQTPPRIPPMLKELPPRIDLEAHRRQREWSCIQEVKALLDAEGHFTTHTGKRLTNPNRICQAIVYEGFTWCEPRHVFKARGLIKRGL